MGQIAEGKPLSLGSRRRVSMLPSSNHRGTFAVALSDTEYLEKSHGTGTQQLSQADLRKTEAAHTEASGSTGFLHNRGPLQLLVVLIIPTSS